MLDLFCFLAVFILPCELLVVGVVDMHSFVAMSTAIIIKTVKPYTIIEEETGIKIIITTVPYITVREETSTETVPHITIREETCKDDEEVRFRDVNKNV